MTNTTASPVRRSGGIVSKLVLLVGLVFVVALVVFVLQNTERIKIEFISLNFDLSIGVAMLIAAAVGVVISVTLGAAFRARRAVK